MRKGLGGSGGTQPQGQDVAPHFSSYLHLEFRLARFHSERVPAEQGAWETQLPRQERENRRDHKALYHHDGLLSNAPQLQLCSRVEGGEKDRLRVVRIPLLLHSMCRNKFVFSIMFWQEWHEPHRFDRHYVGGWMLRGGNTLSPAELFFSLHRQKPSNRARHQTMYSSTLFR